MNRFLALFCLLFLCSTWAFSHDLQDLPYSQDIQEIPTPPDSVIQFYASYGLTDISRIQLCNHQPFSPFRHRKRWCYLAPQEVVDYFKSRYKLRFIKFDTDRIVPSPMCPAGKPGIVKRNTNWRWVYCPPPKPGLF